MSYDPFQFYPTPKTLAEKAFAKFTDRHFVRLLEPSAGDGALLEGMPQPSYHSRPAPVDCIEIDMGKHAGLREKGYNVVGIDFLQFSNGASYSHIILNPPFNAGVEHLLKAWDIAWDAEIVAIINADTLRNPFSKERRQLLNIIEAHGDYEIIEGAFLSDDTERKTPVDIALVLLIKRFDMNSEVFGDIIGNLRQDNETGAGLTDGYRATQELALPASHVENSVIAFRAAVQAMRESVFAGNRATYYARLLGETLAVRNGGGAVTDSELSVGAIQKVLHSSYLELKDRAWAGILRGTQVTSRLSRAAQRRVESEFETIKQLEFNESNIYGFLCGLIENQGEIMNDMMAECFDSIMRFHTCNVCHYKGWVSNNKQRTAGMKIKMTRFIIPGHHAESYQRGMNWETQQFLADFDKCFAALDGKLQPDYGLVQLFTDRFGDLKQNERLDSSYFSVRYFPQAGTMHLFPLRKDLVDRLNRKVGKIRQWLPPVDTMANDNFWFQFSKAEKFDQEIRSEIDKNYRRSRWDDPLWKIARGSEAERAEASARIDEAVSSVLDRHGISTDFLLTNDAGQCLLPLAA